jgi:hypothetical protein
MKYQKKNKVNSDGIRRSSTRLETYDPLEHTLKRLFKVQNMLLKRACEPLHVIPKPVPVPPPPPPLGIQQQPNKPQAFPKSVQVPVPPPPPPPLGVQQPNKPQAFPKSVPPPPPPPPGIQRPKTLQRKKPAAPVVVSGPSINFENLKRKSRAMRAKQIDQLLQTDPVVRAMIKNKSNAEKEDIRKRLVNNHEGLDATTVNHVIQYKTTLNRLRADNRLQNKPESFLMNDIRQYLNKDKNVNKNAITNALHLKNIERAIIRLAGTNLKRGEIPVLVRRLRNKRPETLTINDISNAL